MNSTAGPFSFFCPGESKVRSRNKTFKNKVTIVTTLYMLECRYFYGIKVPSSTIPGARARLYSTVSALYIQQQHYSTPMCTVQSKGAVEESRERKGAINLIQNKKNHGEASLTYKDVHKWTISKSITHFPHTTQNILHL